MQSDQQLLDNLRARLSELTAPVDHPIAPLSAPQLSVPFGYWRSKPQDPKVPDLNTTKVAEKHAEAADIRPLLTDSRTLYQFLASAGVVDPAIASASALRDPLSQRLLSSVHEAKLRSMVSRIRHAVQYRVRFESLLLLYYFIGLLYTVNIIFVLLLVFKYSNLRRKSKR
jgi:hypothetical protein